MALSAQDALIHLMVITASSDTGIISGGELSRIDDLIGRLPIFVDYERALLTEVANACVDQINGTTGLEGTLDAAVAALPTRLHDTGYALAVEIAVVDLELPQEELRLLEMIRDRLEVDRLMTAAIEVAARARLRKA